MINDKWLKLLTDTGTIDVNEALPGFIFLDTKQDYPNYNDNKLVINGLDGEIPGAISFAPFNLVLRFGLDSQDVEDVYLAEQKLRRLFFRRKHYSVVTSDIPNKKFAVATPNIATNVKDFASMEFEVTFQVYKGYSESLYKTDQFSLMSDKWQFESGVMPDNEIAYTHNRQKFSIFNGSDDTIDPRLRHELQIWIRLNTTTGFRLVNKTTGDIFEYKGKLETNQSFLLDGAYPYIETKRCGRLTNHGIITLAPGYNDFEIWGSVSGVNIQFIFPFIYR
ncbi:phage tail domain-containing protein [Staphylococcus carnosus]|uniref:Siphovirus-type tail component RIFT-related domain-containing protein n=1 Tax=Staphylococcus carnosus (strain TM300) TaxID=396513 RepID=B9DJ06_STACT|nr:phage tail domain-containing protein [Staphylococcus carnosus]QPT03600.1 phage tail family protein [Staphylococcus carnosus]UQA66323.1 phage tail family protein [Staphylococcus carnosus]UTB78841.1 phage tail protein [Staphylococcus carnosus]UTB88391.1 phage tail protein [Staphylococcus carnosus]UTB90742.1 phage tail protein [Staphylococcus carnosus]